MDSTSPADGQLPSRYRSVRKAQTSGTSSTKSPPPEDMVHRSRSRYHHQGSRAVRSPEVDPVEQMHASPLPRRSRSLSSRDASSEKYDDPYASQERYEHPPSADRYDHHSSSRERHRTDSPRGPDRSNKVDPRYDQAPQVIQARKEGAIGPKDEVISDNESRSGGCFGAIFRKKRFDPIKNPPKTAAAAPRPVTAHKPKDPPTVKPGGTGVLPGTDAPISASNSADRRILVEYNNSSMLLPVTPDTTAMDLINSAANVFSDPIDVREAVLLEDFSSVGVQRPLRRYERVREIMNSWDDDRADSLLLLPTAVPRFSAAGLSASNASQTQPAEASFLMQYSQKPGYWEKRLITIRQDGQIVMVKDSKKAEVTNVCHLSDFDIYIPTAQQIARKIKPPKKYCYAIKSQQKASMFMSTSTFVHFFCHADQTHAISFYDAVQGWRSWYLVHVMGEGQKKSSHAAVQRSASKRVAHTHPHHDVNNSIGSNYQLGSFKPMDVDMTQFDRPGTSRSSQQSPPAMNQIPSRKLSTRDRAHPPVSLPKHVLPAPQLADDEPLVNMATTRRASLEIKDKDEAFSSGGLLGRSYSTRRREMEDPNTTPFPAVGGLINGAGEIGVARQVSIKRAGSKKVTNGGNPSAHGVARRPSTRDSGPQRGGSTELGRSGSTRVAPKPLIDLTPQYQPPPQHYRRYRNGVTDDNHSGPLIDAVTTEKTWRSEIPESKEWRGRGSQRPAAESNQGRARSMSRNGRDQQGYQQINNRNFSGNSGSAAPSGVHHAAPLLDVSEANNFVKGSLLNRLEKERPSAGPIIDRDS